MNEENLQLMEKLISACEKSDLVYISKNLPLTNKEMRSDHCSHFGYIDFLSKAAITGNTQVISYLFDYGTTPGNGDILLNIKHVISVISNMSHYDALEFVLQRIADSDIHALLVDEDNSLMNDNSIKTYKHGLVSTSLCVAAGKGDWKMIDMVLQYFPDMDISSESFSPLFNAVFGQHWDVAKFLLTSDKFSAPASVAVTNHMTVLFAIEKNNHEMVQYFLYDDDIKNKTNINDVLYDAFKNKKSPENIQVLNYLLYDSHIIEKPEFNANKNKIFKKICDSESVQMLHYVMQHIEFTDEMYEILDTVPKYNDDFILLSQKIINDKKLHDALQNELPIPAVSKQKVKI